MSRLPSLCHPLLLLLVLSSFLCFVIQQNLISLSILYYSFSPFPLLSCPYFLFCFPLDKVLNMMSLKAISMVVVHNTTSLHHTSPADRDLNAPVRIFLMIFFFFPSLDCFWIPLCCVQLLNLWRWDTTKDEAQTQTKLTLCL